MSFVATTLRPTPQCPRSRNRITLLMVSILFVRFWCGSSLAKHTHCDASELIDDVEHDSIAESKPETQSMGKRMNGPNTRPPVILISDICFHSTGHFSRSIQIGVYPSGRVCHDSLAAEINQKIQSHAFDGQCDSNGWADADNSAQTETLHHPSFHHLCWKWVSGAIRDRNYQLQPHKWQLTSHKHTHSHQI